MRKWGLVLFVFLITVHIAYTVHDMKKEPTPLRVGLFVGSGYGVPESEPYAIIDEAIRRFEEKYGIEVTYVSGIRREDYGEWLAERFVEGNEPDIFFIPADDFNLYANMGALKTLNSFIKKDENFDADLYYKAAFDYGDYDGNTCALPVESEPTLMFVNKTLLKNEGIAMPGNDWTWDEFLDICRRVTKDTNGDGVLDQFGCYDFSWQQAAVTNEAQLFREDGRAAYFANERMESVLRFLTELRDIHKGREVTAKDFDMGRVAFRPLVFAEYRAYKPYPWRIKKYADFEWDCVKLPRGPFGSNTSGLETQLVGMSARTDKADTAWEFMKTLCFDRDIQHLVIEKSQGLPVRRDVLTADENITADGEGAIDSAVISEVMDAAVMSPKFKKYPAAMFYADREIKKMLAEGEANANALNKLQKELNAFLQ